MGSLIANYSDTAAYSYNVNDIAQTFPVPAGIDRIDKVRVCLSRTNSVSGNVTISIYATSGGVPTGGAIASASMSANSVSTSKTWYDFSLLANVSPNAQYAIVKSDDTNGSNNINWWRGNSAGYGSGQGFYNSGGWVDYSRDFAFEVYGYQSATIATISLSSVNTPTLTSLDAAGNVTSDGGSTVTERGFCYSSSNSTPTIYDGKLVVSGTTGAYSGTIPNLSAGTSYYVRAYATNALGTAYSGVLSATTSTAAPSITSVGIANITATTATGDGDVTNQNGATVTERGICYNTTGTPTTANSKAVAVSGGAGAYTVNLSSLSPNTTYHTRAYAINAVGTSYGAEIDFTTKDIVVGWYQQFTAGATGLLTKVSLLLRLNQGSSATPVVKIYADNSNVPGTLLATLTAPAITNSVYAWLDIAANLAVTNTTKYWLSLENPYVIGSYEIYLGANSAGTNLLKYKLSSSGTFNAGTGSADIKTYIQPSITVNLNLGTKYKKRYI